MGPCFSEYLDLSHEFKGFLVSTSNIEPIPAYIRPKSNKGEFFRRMHHIPKFANKNFILVDSHMYSRCA